MYVRSGLVPRLFSTRPLYSRTFVRVFTKCKIAGGPAEPKRRSLARLQSKPIGGRVLQVAGARLSPNISVIVEFAVVFLHETRKKPAVFITKRGRDSSGNTSPISVTDDLNVTRDPNGA